MLTKSAARILEDARSLPVQERAEIAAELLETLPIPADSRTDEGWIQEIERRGRKALAGDPGLSWDDVEKMLQAELKSR